MLYSYEESKIDQRIFQPPFSQENFAAILHPISLQYWAQKIYGDDWSSLQAQFELNSYVQELDFDSELPHPSFVWRYLGFYLKTLGKTPGWEIAQWHWLRWFCQTQGLEKKFQDFTVGERTPGELPQINPTAQFLRINEWSDKKGLWAFWINQDIFHQAQLVAEDASLIDSLEDDLVISLQEWKTGKENSVFKLLEVGLIF